MREIPLFHGDQWEITVPSLLGIDQDDAHTKSKGKLDPSTLLRLDAKDVVQKAVQEMQHLKRHFLVVVFKPLEGEPSKDEDPVISTDLTDSRQTFLGQCQMAHWQFNSRLPRTPCLSNPRHDRPPTPRLALTSRAFERPCLRGQQACAMRSTPR